MKYAYALAACAAAMIPQPSFAIDTSQTGNWLLERCSEPQSSFSGGLCIGYIRGIVDGAEMQAIATNSQRSFCFRPEVTAGQARDVVLKELKDDPAGRDRPASIIVFLTLRRNFPCAPEK